MPSQGWLPMSPQISGLANDVLTKLTHGSVSQAQGHCSLISSLPLLLLWLHLLQPYQEYAWLTTPKKNLLEPCHMENHQRSISRALGQAAGGEARPSRAQERTKGQDE